VHVEHLIDVYSYPVCSPTMEGLARLKTAEDLLTAPLLHEENKSWWAAWFAAAGVKVEGALRGPVFQDLALAVDAAGRGQGVALGDAVTAHDGLQAGTLVMPVTLCVPCEAYYLVGPHTSSATEASKAFRDWIKAEMKGFGQASAPAPEHIATL
jgi:LysR family glycine cleavage system transcriptional activator